MSIIERLSSDIEEAGWRATIAPISVRSAAWQDILDRHERGEFDERFFTERIAPYAGAPRKEIAHPRSLIAVSVPDRPVRIRFTLSQGTLATRVPPTYLHGERNDRRVEEHVRELLKPYGFTAAVASGPEKAMLTRSGLGHYGRNNLTFVVGMGSYHRPVVLVSDLPYEGVRAQTEPAVLPRCSTCRACLTACPTGAIGEDRFLLHAERCLTFWNEKPPDVAFPDWIDPEWHHALVGCFRCQEVCPENRAFIGSVVEGPTFDLAATQAILRGAPMENLPPSAQKALHSWDLVGYFDVLPRNLGALVGKVERLGTWEREIQGGIDA